VDQLDILQDLHKHTELSHLLRSCSKLVAASGRPIVIALDGFDSIVDHTPESRRAIFAGLIDAAFTLSSDPLFEKLFVFKLFLPYEIAGDSHTLVWDIDKHLRKLVYLRWDTDEFERFIAKRFHPYVNKRSGVFTDVWPEIMPLKVPNSIHKIEEATIDYVLRHTLHRPRQLLLHLQRILDAWDLNHAVARIDPTFIPPQVSKTNLELSKIVLEQWAHKHPQIITFVHSFYKLPCNIECEFFFDKLSKVFGIPPGAELNQLFDDLYHLGLFGVHVQDQTLSGGRRSLFRFSFVGHRQEATPHAMVGPETVLAFAPMLREFSGCLPCETGVVVPVGSN